MKLDTSIDTFQSIESLQQNVFSVTTKFVTKSPVFCR